MIKATLVLLAAGKGSRFGGPKQIHTFEPQQAPLASYGIWDALQAGFHYFVAIVNHETQPFFEHIFDQFGLKDRSQCVLQEDPSLELGIHRTKPFGTGHALYAARHVITTPFVINNGDNWYGHEAYTQAMQFLSSNHQDCALVGYPLKTVLSSNGSVSRAICSVQNGKVTRLQEYTCIEQTPNGIVHHQDTETVPLASDAYTSVNFWVLQQNVLPALEEQWQVFVQNMTYPESEEFYLPTAIQAIATQQQRPIHLLPNLKDKCLEITYPADVNPIQDYLRCQTQQGRYPLTFG